jgi:hypothetical protein
VATRAGERGREAGARRLTPATSGHSDACFSVSCPREAGRLDRIGIERAQLGSGCRCAPRTRRRRVARQLDPPMQREGDARRRADPVADRDVPVGAPRSAHAASQGDLREPQGGRSRGRGCDRRGCGGRGCRGRDDGHRRAVLADAA